MQRRRFLISTAAAGGALLLAACSGSRAGELMVASGTGKWRLTEAEWRKRLTPKQFHILRQAGTEAPFSSPLNDEDRPGTYVCAGCANPLYSAKTKFHSGTGWPSFWKPLPDAIDTHRDTSLLMVRTEVHCKRCGGHLGHVFRDGPPPTGLRYCMNGAAMQFHPDATGKA